MFKRALTRGVVSGGVAGLAYGCYVALVATPLIRYAETFEAGGEGAAVPKLISTIGSIAGGGLYGILLGAVVFGGLFYLLEPVLPGTPRVQRYVLAAAGFLVVSGIPWLVLPPVPPGVEQSIPTGIRLRWYAVSMGVGALGCGIALLAYGRMKTAHGRLFAVVSALLGLLPVITLVGVTPTNQVTGSAPETVTTVFTATTVAGQLGLWGLLATVHWWLARRDTGGSGSDRIPVAESPSNHSPDSR